MTLYAFAPRVQGLSYARIIQSKKPIPAGVPLPPLPSLADGPQPPSVGYVLPHNQHTVY